MGQDGKSTGLSPGAEGDKDTEVPLPDEDHVSKQLETERGTAGDSFDDKFDDNPETSSRFLLTNVDAGGAAEGSGESIDEDNNVPHDSFSIFYVAKTWNEYILPISVFGLQVLILVLIGINLLQTNNSQLSNRWNVPADVHPSGKQGGRIFQPYCVNLLSCPPIICHSANLSIHSLPRVCLHSR